MPLNDHSKMPCGKAHKGKVMADVPAQYLLWFWGEYYGKNVDAKHQDVLDYIENNMDVIDHEAEQIERAKEEQHEK